MLEQLTRHRRRVADGGQGEAPPQHVALDGVGLSEGVSVAASDAEGGPQFLEHEVGVLAYLAPQGALYLNDKLLR